MPSLREQQLVGLDYLEAVTTLLRRIRSTHPTAGLWEAADRQWSWRTPRPTDTLPQLFWFDDDGRPEAAVITTHSEHGVDFDPMFLPDAPPDWRAHVVERGLAHAADGGFDAVELEVDRADDTMRNVLFEHGFTTKGDGTIEAWLSATARPETSPLHEDYRLSNRIDTMHGPHHMTNSARNHPDPEARLRQTSLYRADLDLVVHDRGDNVAAYGLFWYDPVTATGLVEPMRTEDDHQRRGLARHVLTTGIGLLADAGAERIKIVYEPGNPASRDLYLSVGFEPHRHTDILAGPTGTTRS
jgi:predicted N-acetyltransferase YhbS